MAGLALMFVLVGIVFVLVGRTLYRVHRDDPGPIETRADYDTRRPLP